MLASFVRFISPKGNEIDVISRQIANAHTTFNVVCTLVWLPLIPLMVKIVTTIIRGRDKNTGVVYEPKYLDNKLIAQPAAALQLVAKEVMYCAKLVDEMIGKLQYRNGKIDKENAELVEEKAKILQKLYASVNDCFASLYSGGVLTEEQASQSAGMQYILCDIDRIGQLTREIMETVAKQNKGKHKYSKDALKELKKAMEQIQMIYGSCIQAISGDVNMDIKELMRQKEDIMQLDEKMRKMIAFFDAPTYRQKLKILEEMKNDLDEHMINNMAVSLDLSIEEGMDGYKMILSELKIRSKYETSRGDRL